MNQRWLQSSNPSSKEAAQVFRLYLVSMTLSCDKMSQLPVIALQEMLPVSFCMDFVYWTAMAINHHVMLFWTLKDGTEHLPLLMINNHLEDIFAA